jgi:LPS export ABC transporter protein LptC
MVESHQSLNRAEVDHRPETRVQYLDNWPPLLMNVRKKTIVAAALLIVALSAAAFFVSLERKPGKALLQRMAEKVDLQARDVRYTQVGSEGMKWEITADSASYQKTGEMAVFENVKARVVMKDGRVFLLRGDRGRLNTLSRDMRIDGNVVVESESDGEFRTDSLNYRDNVKRIETERPVVIKNKRIQVSGVGMRFNLTDEHLTILARVRATSSAGRQEREK